MWGAASIGIGAIIGAGIFVLSGVTSGFSGAALINGIVIALIIIVTKGELQLRKKMPDASRTFKVPFYPITPILGLIICFGLLFYLKKRREGNPD